MPMKMFNTIAMFDVYIVAESGEAAREAMLKAIHAGDLTANEATATESQFERSIRQGYRDEKPFVAEDVSDADFKKILGKTTIEIFRALYTKRG